MSKKKSVRTLDRSKPNASAPAVVQQLAGRFLRDTDKRDINRAFAAASRLLNQDHMWEPDQDVDGYVEAVMVEKLDAITPDIRLRRHHDAEFLSGVFACLLAVHGKGRCSMKPRINSRVAVVASAQQMKFPLKTRLMVVTSYFLDLSVDDQMRVIDHMRDTRDAALLRRPSVRSRPSSRRASRRGGAR